MTSPNRFSAQAVRSLLWRDKNRKVVTVTAGMILLGCLLYLWLPYRVAAVQFFIKLGGSRLFIGAEYSPVDGPRYVSYCPSVKIDGYPSNTEVIGLEMNGVSKAIPVKRIAWHMVFNDEIAGDPAVVTLCTVTNAAMAYRARHKGRALHFRPIGLNRNNLVMLDAETQSRWQQFTGKAITGPLAGTELQRIPLQRLSLDQWQRLHPQGSILEPLRNDEDTTTPHDTCPVMCYFPSEPFLLQKPGVEDDRLPRKQFVLGVITQRGEKIAYPAAMPDSHQESPSSLRVGCYWFAWAEFFPGSRIESGGMDHGT